VIEVGRGANEINRIMDAHRVVDAAEPTTPIMSSQERLNATLAAILSDRRGAPSATMRICDACSELLPVSGAAISLRGDITVPSTVYASDAVVQRVEDLQLSTGEGPCVSAVASGRPVLVADLTDRAQETRWPVFTVEALSAGVGAVFAFPLNVGLVRLGALDLYRDVPGELTRPDVEDALTVATAAGTALVQQWEAGPSDDLDERWWGGESFYQAAVHQATGRVMAQFSIEPAEALVRLRAFAFLLGRPLPDVAREVADGVLRLDPDALPHSSGDES
jgi:hypothetical protein